MSHYSRDPEDGYNDEIQRAFEDRTKTASAGTRIVNQSLLEAMLVRSANLVVVILTSALIFFAAAYKTTLPTVPSYNLNNTAWQRYSLVSAHHERIFGDILHWGVVVIAIMFLAIVLSVAAYALATRRHD